MIESTVDDLDLMFESASLEERLEDDDQEDYEREPMNSIDFYVIYINSDMAIEKIVCENEPIIPLEKGKHGIQKDRILQIIQQKRFVNDKKYKLLNYFYFHIPLEQDQLQSFVKNNALEFPDFMKSPSYLTDLVIEDSVSIFHDINSVFLFLKANESPRFLSKTAKKLGVPVPHSQSSSRITKKVRFQTD